MRIYHILIASWKKFENVKTFDSMWIWWHQIRWNIKLDVMADTYILHFKGCSLKITSIWLYFANAKNTAKTQHSIDSFISVYSI